MEKLPIKAGKTILSLSHSIEPKEFIQFYLDNKSHLDLWEPAPPSDFYSEKYWKFKLNEFMDECLNNSSLRLAIREKSKGQLIGFINFTGFERGPFQACRLGYKLDFRFEGRGYMSESLRPALKFMFEELNFHRIEANYIPENFRSGRLLERLGFQKEGFAKNYLKINGKWQDHFLTSLTNPNWQES